MGCGSSSTKSLELDATQHGLQELKRWLENKTQKAKTDPETEPDVFITIDEITKENAGAIRFSPQQFAIRGLVVRTRIEVVGTAAKLAGLAATKATQTMMDKAGLSQERKAMLNGGLSKIKHEAVAAKGKVEEKLCIERSRSFDRLRRSDMVKMDRLWHNVTAEVTLDMVKQFGSDEITITIRDIHTDIGIVEAVLSNDATRNFIEDWVSKKVSEVVAGKIRQMPADVKRRINSVTDEIRQDVSKKTEDLLVILVDRNPFRRQMSNDINADFISGRQVVSHTQDQCITLGPVH